MWTITPAVVYLWHKIVRFGTHIPRMACCFAVQLWRSVSTTFRSWHIDNVPHRLRSQYKLIRLRHDLSTVLFQSLSNLNETFGAPKTSLVAGEMSTIPITGSPFSVVFSFLAWPLATGGPGLHKAAVWANNILGRCMPAGCNIYQLVVTMSLFHQVRTGTGINSACIVSVLGAISVYFSWSCIWFPLPLRTRR